MSQAPPPPRRRRDSLFRYPHSVEIVALGLRRTTSSEMLPIESSGDDDSDSGKLRSNMVIRSLAVSSSPLTSFLQMALFGYFTLVL